MKDLIMCKVSVITDELLVKYHPKFMNAPKAYIKWFKELNSEAAFSRSIGNLVAEALAHASSTLTYTDANGMDYSDGTDKKVVAMSTDGAIKIKVGECGNISKTGDLRVTVFNPNQASLHYLYIPYNFWINKVRWSGGGLCTVNFTYSKRTNTFTLGFEDCVVDSFDELIARKPG